MKLNNLLELIEKTQQRLRENALTAVNVSLTLRNWMIGCYIFGYEQKGEDRAKYGEKLIQELADGIRDKKIKGMSATNLKLFRQFYMAYPEIGQSLTDQSLKWISDTGGMINQSLTDEWNMAMGSNLTYSFYIWQDLSGMNPDRGRIRLLCNMIFAYRKSTIARVRTPGGA
jgi:hypothetical protein